MIAVNEARAMDGPTGYPGPANHYTLAEKHATGTTDPITPLSLDKLAIPQTAEQWDSQPNIRIPLDFHRQQAQ